MTSGQAIAAVSTVGYLGFLVGPPLIGAAAELAGLRVGLGLVVLLVAVIPGLATALGGDATAARVREQPEPGPRSAHR
jgi:MFS family permease